MEKENKGAEPKKVGYLKYLRLQKRELGENYILDDSFAFQKNISRGEFFIFCAFFLIVFPICFIIIRSTD